MEVGAAGDGEDVVAGEDAAAAKGEGPGAASPSPTSMLRMSLA